MRKGKVCKGGLTFLPSLELSGGSGADGPLGRVRAGSARLSSDLPSSPNCPSSFRVGVPRSPHPLGYGTALLRVPSPPLPVGRRLAQLPRLTDDINTVRLALANPLGGVRAKS